MSTSLPPQASFTENTDKANMRRLFSRPQTRSGGALLRKMVAPGNPEERAWRKLMGSESTVYQQEHGHVCDPLERGLGSQVPAHLAQVGRKEPHAPPILTREQGASRKMKGHSKCQLGLLNIFIFFQIYSYCFPCYFLFLCFLTSMVSSL